MWKITNMFFNIIMGTCLFLYLQGYQFTFMKTCYYMSIYLRGKVQNDQWEISKSSIITWLHQSKVKKKTAKNIQKWNKMHVDNDDNDWQFYPKTNKQKKLLITIIIRKANWEYRFAPPLSLFLSLSLSLSLSPSVPISYHTFPNQLTQVCPCVGVHRRTSLLLQHVLPVLLEWFVRWNVNGYTSIVCCFLWGGAAFRICSKRHAESLCSFYLAFFPGVS